MSLPTGVIFFFEDLFEFDVRNIPPLAEFNTKIILAALKTFPTFLDMFDLTSVEPKWVAVVAVVAPILCIVQAFYFLKSKFVVEIKKVGNVPTKSLSETDYKEAVTAYLFNSPGSTVSGSPFSTKLSMYLRLAGIPHNIREANFEKAPKSKVPYIKHGKAFFGDSQLIIRYLENTFDVSKMAVKAAKEFGISSPFVPFEKLSPADQGLCDLVRLTCEGEMYWALISVRWCGEMGMGKSESLWRTTCAVYFAKLPAFLRNIIPYFARAALIRDAWGQGMSRHSPDDQLYLACRASKSLSNILGKKQFFLGDAPSECDCIAFGALQNCADDSQWPNPLTDYMRKECPNLLEYVARIRTSVFQDMKAGDERPLGRPTGEAFPKK